MFNLILNEENIINIHKHPFSNEKCSARWESNPALLQSSWVPYHLDHWHHLLLGTLPSESICTSDICSFCTWMHLPSATFSQMYDLILNEENIINIHEHLFSNEKCSTKWDSNPCLLQSSWVPYHLDHWHCLFLATLIQGLYAGSDMKTLSFVCDCHLQSTWFSASVICTSEWMHLHIRHLSLLHMKVPTFSYIFSDVKFDMKWGEYYKYS